MITIKLKPSFHHHSLITLGEEEVEYEIIPKLEDVSGFEKIEKLTTAQYLRLKKLKSFNLNAEKQRYKEKKQIKANLQYLRVEIEKIINQVIENPEVDERIILDGIEIECFIGELDSEMKKIKFHSPEKHTKVFKIVENLFLILNDCFQEGPVLNHIESTQGYFGIGEQWKITNENPLILRICGSLSIYEKEALNEFLNTLKPNQFLILDISNLDGMGFTLHECFKSLIHKMKAVFWLVLEKENDYLNRHFDEMGVLKKYVFTDKEVIIKKVKELNSI